MRALLSRFDRGGSSAALVAATILIALCGASPAHALTVGFLDPTLQTQDNARFWSDMTTLRASVVRYDAYWNEIAPVRPARPRDPAPPEYRWEVLDRLVVDAAAHRAEIVLTLWRTPRWARADGGRGGKPNLYSWAPRSSDWRAFVYAAAVRYSGSFDPDGLGYGGPLPRVRFWEVWNEPNYIGALRPQRAPGKGGKPGTPVSPTTYTALLNAAYAELGRVERERRIALDVLGGSMNRGFAGPGSVAPLIFLRGMRKAGARFDIASPAPLPADRPRRLHGRHPSAERDPGQHRRLPARARPALADQALPRLADRVRHAVQARPVRRHAGRPGGVRARRAPQGAAHAAHLHPDLVPDSRRTRPAARASPTAGSRACDSSPAPPSPPTAPGWPTRRDAPCSARR